MARADTIYTKIKRELPADQQEGCWSCGGFQSSGADGSYLWKFTRTRAGKSRELKGEFCGISCCRTYHD